MRRYAPVIFAVLSALFLVERAITGGALGGDGPQVVGLHDMAPLGAGSECLPKAGVLQTLALTGARLSEEPTPFCTDRPDLTDWVLADETTGSRHLAFDAQGCLVVWNPSDACP